MLPLGSNIATGRHPKAVSANLFTLSWAIFNIQIIVYIFSSALFHQKYKKLSAKKLLSFGTKNVAEI